MPRSSALYSWLTATALLTATAPAQHEGVTPEPGKVTPAAEAAATASTTVDFLRDVRPILADHCYACHGPDKNERKGDLRLDRRSDALEDRGGYAAVTPGNPDDSELLVRITSDDPEAVMPPPDCDDALEPREIAILRAWIANDAPWQEHWAFVPPTRPSPPPVKNSKWANNDLDAFVLARLEQAGKQPSKPAARETWLRRVTFDLIGLPPTPDEIDSFVADTSDEAFQKVVDRLLADERYGERMASDWLDVARYADSSGYQRDRSRQAWKWRDWVIKSLNDNMPFDQFTIEQLAGDLLPEPTLEQRIATGFNRNHPVNTEAGEELDEYRSAYVIDRVHATTTTWLGLTVACAQCHDHKYDPISQKEFYSFYGFFNSIKEKDNGSGRNPKPAIAAPDPDDLPKLRDLEARIKMLKERLEQDDPISDRFQTKWEEGTRARLGKPIEWTTLRPSEFMARYGSRLKLQADGSLLATGPTPSRDTYDLVFTPGSRKIQALRIEVLPDPSLPHGASGRADDGRFILSKLTSQLSSVSDSSDPPLIAYAVAAADVNQERDRDEHYLTAINPGSFAASIAVDDGKSSGGSSRRSFGGWSISGDERKQARHAVLIPMKPLKSNDTSILRLTLEQNSRNKFKSLIGRFRISFTEDVRIREHLVPLASSHWRSIGPFPAQSTEAAFATAYGPEKHLEKAMWKKKHDQPILPKPEKKSSEQKSTEKKSTGKGGAGKDGTAKTPQAKSGSDKGKAPEESPSKKLTEKQPPEKKPTTTAPTEKAAPNAAEAPGDKKRNKTAKQGKPTQPKPKAKAKATSSAKPEEAKPKKKPKPKRLSWQEQRGWRDGRSATLPLEGPAAASYVSRKLTTGKARTARMEFRGGVGAKVWLNGKVVGDFAPEPTPAAKPATPTKSPGFDPANFDPAMGFDPSMFRSRRPTTKPRELRIGLRKGENHLVIKLIGKGASASSSRRRSSSSSASPGSMSSPSSSRRSRGSSLSFSFEIEAEGDDVLDYEAMLAVQARTTTPESESLNASPAEASTSKDEKKANKSKRMTPAERQAKAVRTWYRTRIDAAGRVLAAELRKLEREKSEFERKLPSAMVMEELEDARDTHLFVRGDYRNRGEKVAVGTPSMLPPMPKDLPRNRLGLAQWLVSGKHPLTARVTVNRAWQKFFGRGIVSTPGDFGIRGAQPSHPKLLDWLACEFVQNGWNLKALHKQIVLSATYRQSGVTSKSAVADDPDNVMLARGPHQRLTAEMVRDQALHAAGLLVQKLGGESVKPFQPKGLWRATLGSGSWSESKGDDKYRRGLYVYWKRGVPYPSFMAFDASKRETCTVQRTLTTTPLQALVTLNDPVYVEAGRHLGKRLLDEEVEGKGPDQDRARLIHGFRLVTSRQPEAREVEILGSLLADLRKHYAADEDAAKAVLGLAKKATKATRGRGTPSSSAKGAKTAGTEATSRRKQRSSRKRRGKPAKEIAPAEAAAWAQLGCTLLNLEAAIRRG